MMPRRIERCVVVEIPPDECGGGPPKDLLPWADPYIARLLSKHRLRSALDDSLRFVEDQAERLSRHDSDQPPGARRFDDLRYTPGNEWRFD